MKVLRFFLYGSLLLILTSCSSIQEHAKYRYVAPDTTAGKRCVARCSVAKNSCEDICAMKHPSCAKKTDESCKHLCHCTSAYNLCYTACGGQVI